MGQLGKNVSVPVASSPGGWETVTETHTLLSVHPACASMGHQYMQGNDSAAGTVYSDKLYCSKCGDVLVFELPREDGAD